jgi:hypothetical protein
MLSKSAPKILKFRQRFGRQVAKLIGEKGYPSVENFCLSNGLHKATVHQVIKGTADPRLSTLLRVADALEMELDEILLSIRQ